jgi:hypothetical protein
MRLILTILACSVPTILAEECNEQCSDEFVGKCIPFKKGDYSKCREELDNGIGPMMNKGCVMACTDTTAMAATKDGSGNNNDNASNTGSSNTGSSNTGSSGSNTGSSGSITEGDGGSVEGLTSVPVLCTASNQGRCECTTWAGANTYTWSQNSEQRCATVYNTQTVTSKTVPVMLDMQCYAKDKLPGMRPKLAVADKYGMAWIYMSSPTGHWSGQAAVCGTEDSPMSACDDNNDLEYVNTVLKYLVSSSENNLDSSQVYTSGFSQNGMFSGFVGTCLGSEKIAGSWIGGAGLFMQERSAPVPPGKEGTGNGCKYWPAYPCYDDSARSTKLKVCLQTYADDRIVVDQVRVTCVYWVLLVRLIHLVSGER